ncbi:MAG: TOMM precursor leader peptide-binding protein, partial [Anaerolineae bacterium]|nr:TOMM precursor leader peptide-binding protein [Anaerolineae bacterium]
MLTPTITPTPKAMRNLRMPQLKSCYLVAPVEGDGIFLVTENAFQYRLLRNRIYTDLVPLLDGTRTNDEILSSLQSSFSTLDVTFGLAQMQKEGLIHEADAYAGASMPERAYWDSVGQIAMGLPISLAKAKTAQVFIQTVAETTDAALRDAFESLNIRICDDSQTADLTIVITDDYLRPELHEMNAQALRTGKPWLLVKLVGAIAWIGPLFVPHAASRTACWRCLAQRLEDNRQVESYILHKKAQQEPLPTSRVQLPSIHRIAANLAATEAYKWIVCGKNPAIEGQVITYDALNSELRSHAVVRRPQCSACGDPAEIVEFQLPRPVQLRTTLKRDTAEVGHRSALPEETYKKFEHHISPITGVISSLTSMTTHKSDSDGLLYSYAAGHNFALLQDDMVALRKNSRGQSGGKGTTDMQARVSAMGEAIERYSGVYRGDEPVTRASYVELIGKAVHPNDYLLFSPRQYAQRHEWNRQRTNNYHIVPNPFDERLVTDWTAAWSIGAQAFKYVPTAYCYYGHPDVLAHFYCGTDANGCAAGNTLEEAIVQGFLELVERDGVALWWNNRLRKPGVDMSTFNVPRYAQLQDHYRKLNRNLQVLNLTSDLGIPIFAAVSGRTDVAVEDILVGVGAHFDPHVAVIRKRCCRPAPRRAAVDVPRRRCGSPNMPELAPSGVNPAHTPAT